MNDFDKLRGDALTPEQFLEQKRDIIERAAGSLASETEAVLELSILQAQNPSITAVAAAEVQRLMNT